MPLTEKNIPEKVISSTIIDRFHCHATKKNKLKTIQWKKLRNWDVIEDKKIIHFSKF